MITIRDEAPTDIGAREALLDRVFGPGRFRKTSQRLREGRIPANGLALTAGIGANVIGTLRLWEVMAGEGRAALLLGPLAVAPEHQGTGVGARLIGTALNRAAGSRFQAVLLVGSPAYYGRFGFEQALTTHLYLPGPYDPGRFLGLNLRPRGLAGAGGLVTAAARPALETITERAMCLVAA